MMDLYGFRPAARAAVQAGVLLLVLVAALSFAAADLVHPDGQWQYLASALAPTFS